MTSKKSALNIVTNNKTPIKTQEKEKGSLLKGPSILEKQKVRVQRLDTIT